MPTPDEPAALSHRLVRVPGGRIHVVEQGTGPLVLLVHGFPETWYSWRHQLPALAAAGFRAVAIDVRGYGRSSKPAAVAEYGMLAHVADNVGVVHALGEETAIVVGHDWGSPIAANSALLRPDVFTAVALLSVPYAPRGERRPTELYASIDPAREFYINYIQEPGRAEAEIEPDVRQWLLGMYAALSGDTMHLNTRPDVTLLSPGGLMSEGFPDVRPHWLSGHDLDVYAESFERSGMTGALNRYRNVDRDWSDLAAWHRAPIRQRSLFIGGALDPTLTRMTRAIEAHPATLPGLVSSHVLDGCGHWVQQERASAVNDLLIDWLPR